MPNCIVIVPVLALFTCETQGVKLTGTSQVSEITTAHDQDLDPDTPDFNEWFDCYFNGTTDCPEKDSHGFYAKCYKQGEDCGDIEWDLCYGDC